MATRTSFEDPSSGTGVFTGDLKYGRCQGNRLNLHHDYPAKQDGQANQPAAPLILRPKRDPQVWADKAKTPKVKVNTKDFSDQFMMKLAMQTGGLIRNVRVVKFGNKLSQIR